MTKLKLMQNKQFDELYTPVESLDSLLPFIDFIGVGSVVWECAFGTGVLAKHLEDKGFKVVGNNDFFNSDYKCDMIISNPPYSIKRKFIEKAINLNKPFAFLVPITTLEGKKSSELFNNGDIQIIIPNKRIDFLKKGSSSWFAVMWITKGLNLPNQINYFDMKQLEND